VREILCAIGEDPARDGIRDTPRRVAKAYAEVFAGLHQTAEDHLGRVFEQKCDELITVTGIGFHSMCEHHLLPFFGKAHVAYLPQAGRVVGLSKLARTVEVFAKRPQLQERLTEQVADALMDHLDPAGCVVMVEAEHLCMKMRGVKTADSMMTTFVRRGVFRADEARGDRAMALVRDLAAKTRC
jgi:GTP cyclohydrolase I